METGRFLSSDNKTNVYWQLWPTEKPPVAVLQIVHGMAEIIDRYSELAAELNAAGIVVAGDDHIGHGHSADPEDYGYFGESNGWLHFIDDEEKMRKILAEKYPGVPYIMMGHSMGSFICRGWLAHYGQVASKENQLAGAIICGSAGTNKALAAGLALTKGLRKAKGSRHISKLITAIAFGSYNKGIENPKTNYDWLTHDEKIVNAYVENPMCGFIFTLAGYEDLFRLMEYISTDQCYGAMPKDIPYLIVSGMEDPVGEYGKGPLEIKERLEKSGCSMVEEILYQGMRHEIHTEIGGQVPRSDMRDFCLDAAQEAKDK